MPEIKILNCVFKGLFEDVNAEDEDEICAQDKTSISFFWIKSIFSIDGYFT
ncbi:MAG: hypothetical protein QG591_1915 [Planctomycetota bacterium]|jgi:hypothetical protein|nr:hypothetical protein [Planctomycetota bacterium]